MMVAAISAFSLLREGSWRKISIPLAATFLFLCFLPLRLTLLASAVHSGKDSSHLTKSDLRHGQALEEGSAGSFQCPNINRRASRHT